MGVLLLLLRAGAGTTLEPIRTDPIFRSFPARHQQVDEIGRDRLVHGASLAGTAQPFSFRRISSRMTFARSGGTRIVETTDPSRDRGALADR
jgi:hypothetical protein